MRITTAIALLALASTAHAGADGDGFTVQDGDCNDNDPTIYPGAPEVCDGIDNDCDQITVSSTFLMSLGNGNWGEGLTFKVQDGLWWHSSGSSDTQEFFESVDVDTQIVGANLAPADTYGPDPATELNGIVWYEPLGVFLAYDDAGSFFHISPSGDFTQMNTVSGGGGSGWWYVGPAPRGYAVVGTQVYGVDQWGTWMYEIDPVDGSIIQQRPLFIDGQISWGCSAMTHDPTTGQVWALCTDPNYLYYYYYYYYTGYTQGDVLVEVDVVAGEGVSHGPTGQFFGALSIDDQGRFIAVTDDTNYLGSPEALYELTIQYGGGPQPGELDEDGDGYLGCEECDDTNASIYPGAPEICDDLDNDCDGVLPYDEADNDGDGVSLCMGDCDDTDPTLTPGRPELCDGQDNDCDGLPGADEVDNDGDGELQCRDCDDNNPAVNHFALEACDGLDTDCDGSTPQNEADLDGDGSPQCADCDDANASNTPGAAEVCDGYDNDCDALPGDDEWDEDFDGVMVCEGDCDDSNPNVFPGATDVPGDGIDQDCDGSDAQGGGGGGGGGGGNGDDPKGCGCSSGGSGSSWLAIGGLFSLFLRRRS